MSTKYILLVPESYGPNLYDFAEGVSYILSVDDHQVKTLIYAKYCDHKWRKFNSTNVLSEETYQNTRAGKTEVWYESFEAILSQEFTSFL